ncbi:MAG: N-acetyl-gamma-glutamyl-phosphate reductase, partial [Cyclobacteriaceae bacterium]
PETVDVLFLCKGHGESEKYLSSNHVPVSVKIIDLSQDFRLQAKNNVFVYGLPELNKPAIKSGNRIANPGCFATSIQLGLLPAAAGGLIKSDIHISGITGSTGAGQSFSRTSHFSWRNNNVSVYKAFAHQHLEEIGESLSKVSSHSKDQISFVPYRGNFSRGIITTSYFRTEADIYEAIAVFQDYYEDHPFVFVTDRNPDLKQVINTNKALVYLEKQDNRLMVISVIDNLLKGASGQAVQNMNLAFGRAETSGLLLKSIAF